MIDENRLPVSAEPTSSGSLKQYRSNDDRVNQMVDLLREFGRDRDKRSECRTALAELRQAVNHPYKAAKYVVPCFKESRQREDEIMFYQVASLFALHPEHRSGTSLGDAFRKRKKESDSIEGRFKLLLSSSPDLLATRLRGAITLMASGTEPQPLDWYKLMDDVLWWGHPDKSVQYRLARDFYRTSNPAEAATSTISEPIVSE